MARNLYYLLASLPSLGEIGTSPPMGLAELLDWLEPSSRYARLAGLVFLSDDLLQREAFLAGQLQEPAPAVLEVGQIRNESPLPDFLIPPEEGEEIARRALQTDQVWAAYFRYVIHISQIEKAPFLNRWARMEVSLRNALAQERAKRLGLEPTDYLVAQELADPEADFTEMLREWASAPTPLAGWRVVLRQRWNWCRANEAWFSFTEDELLVYAVRLLLLHQWRRSSEEEAALAAKT
ncbi:MAG: DUF2764 domain-containing protein [Thermoguttaceae bacterium]|nr:DUF2764 domain-containing protein [Thermoguttaceae bacterium]MDW8037188.1 hypothetical protein [Thermoguttaceae bacterium]